MMGVGEKREGQTRRSARGGALASVPGFSLVCAAQLAVFGLVLLTGMAAWSQEARRIPQIGYLYPAGGQEGTTFLVTVGGQNLRGVKGAEVSGEGVQAKVVKNFGRFRNPSKEQRDELERRMKAVRDRRKAEAAGKPLPPEPAPPAEDAGGDKKKQSALPNHPLLYDLDNFTLRELAHLRHELRYVKQKQQAPQLAESVIIEVAIGPGASLGDREMRLITAGGLTNPMCFQVGAVPEVRELEPNGEPPNPKNPKDPALDLPVVVNGQIMPGDVDRFRFRAKEGQRLTVAAQARHLVPYLADAVPGWFQATVALYDAKRKEIAYEDDFRFNPDPVLFYKIPHDGLYEVEIRDAIFRGRDDFVYRISLGEQPFIARAFPLGAQEGSDIAASISGWNLKKDQLSLDTKPGAAPIREVALRQGKWLTNPVFYAVSTLPESNEDEPNNTERKAQRVKLPLTVNGRIDTPGDVDVYEFKGHAGDEVVAEILGRQLHSPIDSVLRLQNASGEVVAWNDDCMHKDGHLHTDSGLLTHHADSYLRVKLPKSGKYRICVSDAQDQGGEAYAYRLSMAPPQPRFALRVAPSTVNIPVGRSATMCVYVDRKDGFDGPIDIALKDAPPEFMLDGGRIPAGANRVRMTLTVRTKTPKRSVALHLEGRAQIDGKEMACPVMPADDSMQAFLWRHLAPAREFMVSVTGGKRNQPPVMLANHGTVRIPEKGKAEVLVRVPKNPLLPRVRLALNGAPEGLSVQDVKVVPEGLSFTVKADGDKAKAGLADNLIVDVTATPPPRNPNAKGPKPSGPIPLGVLPAIAFEVVKP